MVRSRFI